MSLVLFTLILAINLLYRLMVPISSGTNRYHSPNILILDTIRTGDQSPLKGTVNIEKQTVSWSNNRNLENILVFNLPLVKGAKWSANKRNWKQNYEVVDTGISLITKTGILKDCIQVKISWIANEPDMQGLQEISLYLAPNLGIVKQQHFDNGHMWHEEVLTKISKE
jgi:hypothetical protein